MARWRPNSDRSWNLPITARGRFLITETRSGDLCGTCHPSVQPAHIATAATLLMSTAAVQLVRRVLPRATENSMPPTPASQCALRTATLTARCHSLCMVISMYTHRRPSRRVARGNAPRCAQDRLCGAPAAARALQAAGARVTHNASTSRCASVPGQQRQHRAPWSHGEAEAARASECGHRRQYRTEWIAIFRSH